MGINFVKTPLSVRYSIPTNWFNSCGADNKIFNSPSCSAINGDEGYQLKNIETENGQIAPSLYGLYHIPYNGFLRLNIEKAPNGMPIKNISMVCKGCYFRDNYNKFRHGCPGLILVMNEAGKYILRGPNFRK